ncbi:MAG TPA: hypothetical protein VK190_02420 [Pseudoneobacillus sp.]|nr:hypothetical protein [Pseudoneobacillus sp.]
MKKICDICGEECSNSGRYELTYKCYMRHQRQDICFHCLEELKKAIRNKKISIKSEDELLPQKVVDSF